MKYIPYEIWRDIPGYEGLYRCSTMGNIYSTRKGVVVRPKNNGRNYLFVKLHKNGIAKPEYIHRLVAKIFVPNPKGFTQVNHKDENTTRNVVSNLEWVDAYTNCNYGTRNKRISATKLNKSKAIEQYSVTGEYIGEWNSILEAARTLGFDASGIASGVYRGGSKIKTRYGFIWKYKQG